MENLDKILLSLIERQFTEELDVIQDTMINYYSLKNQKDQNQNTVLLYRNLMRDMLKYFDLLSKRISKILEIDSNTIYNALIDLFIKT